MSESHAPLVLYEVRARRTPRWVFAVVSAVVVAMFVLPEFWRRDGHPGWMLVFVLAYGTWMVAPGRDSEWGWIRASVRGRHAVPLKVALGDVSDVSAARFDWILLDERELRVPGTRGTAVPYDEITSVSLSLATRGLELVVLWPGPALHGRLKMTIDLKRSGLSADQVMAALQSRIPALSTDPQF